jgi:hypothetical protein
LLSFKHFAPVPSGQSWRYWPFTQQRWGVTPDVRYGLIRRMPRSAHSLYVDVVFRFARDSPLEGTGFEPSVPPQGTSVLYLVPRVHTLGNRPMQRGDGVRAARPSE